MAGIGNPFIDCNPEMLSIAPQAHPSLQHLDTWFSQAVVHLDTDQDRSFFTPLIVLELVFQTIYVFFPEMIKLEYYKRS